MKFLLPILMAVMLAGCGGVSTAVDPTETQQATQGTEEINTEEEEEEKGFWERPLLKHLTPSQLWKLALLGLGISLLQH